MFEDESEPTFLFLCAAEWHCIGYGFSDVLDGKPICQESFLQDISLYSTAEQEILKSRYHYYRAAGSGLAYAKSHWAGITAGATALAAAAWTVLKG